MKNKTKLVITLALACAGTLTLGACKSKDYYESMKKDRQVDAIVRFDPNGGLFKNEEGLIVTNGFKYEELPNGKGNVLFAPNDSRKTSSSFDGSIDITNGGHFLCGWYKNRELRTDEQGRPVDEDGNLCSESGKPQAYSYSGRWNFGDKLKQSDFEEQENGIYTMTLYAGWIPHFSYRIVDETNTVVAETVFDPTTESGQAMVEEIPIPTWNEETGVMDYGDFPKAEKKTFVAVHASKDSTENLEFIHHSGEVDLEHGVATNVIQTFYGEFRQGEWFRIRKVTQLAKNLKPEGCYEILEDLDFDEKDAKGYTVAYWSSGEKGFSTVEFSGQFIGNGHTIKNISVVDSRTDGKFGGVFGAILENAVIKDLTFENVSYTLSRGARFAGANFGLFAGEIRQGAKIENVKVTGKLTLGDVNGMRFAGTDIYNYYIGKVSGNRNDAGITSEIEVEGVNGVQVTIGNDGSITATAK